MTSLFLIYVGGGAFARRFDLLCVTLLLASRLSTSRTSRYRRLLALQKMDGPLSARLPFSVVARQGRAL